MSKRVWNHINKSGAPGTQKDQDSLKSKKTRRVWNRKRPGESGTKQIRSVWDQKDQENLELEDGRPGESETGRGKTRRV
jgi:hypothetical protein